jgi:hypothetical protein
MTPHSIRYLAELIENEYGLAVILEEFLPLAYLTRIGLDLVARVIFAIRGTIWYSMSSFFIASSFSRFLRDDKFLCHFIAFL